MNQSTAEVVIWDLMRRPDILEAHMEAAQAYAKLSRASRRKVGAIIVKDGSTIGIGWNGTPPGWDNSCEGPDGHTLPEVIHAEQNALDKIMRSTNSSVGAVLFVTTAPCEECAKRIIGAQIAAVFYREEYRNADGLALLARDGIGAVQLKGSK